MTALSETEQKSVKRSLTAALAAKFDMEPKIFLETVKNTVMPSNATTEEVCAFLMVAREYDMNPLLREIHAFPKKGGGIQTVVGVDGWAKIITRNEDYDGVDFEYFDDEKSGKPVAVTCVLYRKSCSRPTKVTEYYDECKRNTEPWNTMPRRMLRHKALMQCGRIAFGLSGIIDEDEARDFCEADVVVIEEDDPLTPGRHNNRKPKQQKQQDPENLQEQPDEEQAEADAQREESLDPNYTQMLYSAIDAAEIFEIEAQKWLKKRKLKDLPIEELKNFHDYINRVAHKDK